MARRSTPQHPKINVPLVVLVGRHPRCAKVRELTEGWSDAQWKALCSRLKNDRLPKSCLPAEGLLILPDFEALEDVEHNEIHLAVKSIFAHREEHAGGCILTILSCFEENGPVDVLLRRSFETMLSVKGEHGKAILLFTSDF